MLAQREVLLPLDELRLRAGRILVDAADQGTLDQVLEAALSDGNQSVACALRHRAGLALIRSADDGNLDEVLAKAVPAKPLCEELSPRVGQALRS